MQFIKTRDVKNPERNVAENAGIDIYIPNNTPEFVEATFLSGFLTSLVLINCISLSPFQKLFIIIYNKKMGKFSIIWKKEELFIPLI